jgi:Ca2+-dependent lipid-binding protein
LDRTLQLNHGKFADNGGSGYVLKPEWMRKPSGARAPPKKLALTIISGQQLPKPNQTSKGEIIDPYVEVEIVGEDEDTVSKKTKVVDDNGFNPQWDETFEFSVKSPEITLVRFVVYVSDFAASSKVN